MMSVYGSVVGRAGIVAQVSLMLQVVVMHRACSSFLAWGTKQLPTFGWWPVVSSGPEIHADVFVLCCPLQVLRTYSSHQRQAVLRQAAKELDTSKEPVTLDTTGGYWYDGTVS